MLDLDDEAMLSPGSRLAGIDVRYTSTNSAYAFDVHIECVYVYRKSSLNVGCVERAPHSPFPVACGCLDAQGHVAVPSESFDTPRFQPASLLLQVFEL